MLESDGVGWGVGSQHLGKAEGFHENIKLTLFWFFKKKAIMLEA